MCGIFDVESWEKNHWIHIDTIYHLKNDSIFITIPLFVAPSSRFWWKIFKKLHINKHSIYYYLSHERQLTKPSFDLYINFFRWLKTDGKKGRLKSGHEKHDLCPTIVLEIWICSLVSSPNRIGLTFGMHLKRRQTIIARSMQHFGFVYSISYVFIISRK